MSDCTRCKFHKNNAEYESREESFCYFFKVGVWDVSDGICSQFEPTFLEDTAEENLMDNQL